MRKRKLERSDKRQRGQFMTPPLLARDIVRSLDLRGVRRILEPSCGNGSFVEAVLDLYQMENEKSPGRRAKEEQLELVAVEVDADLLTQCKQRVISGEMSDEREASCTLLQGDFFQLFMDRHGLESKQNSLAEKFDLIIGNPPFGGSFSPEIEDDLDAILGSRFGRKIKKETYAFFIVACTELLRPGGRLIFICSDTLLTIPTMTGLRQYLMESGTVVLHELGEFSDETNYPMLVLEYVHQNVGGGIEKFRQILSQPDIEATPNLSWGVTPEVARLFRGPSLGDFFVASSGMTTGKNEFFVREVSADSTISEPFDFRFYQAPISVKYELERARLNKLPKSKLRSLAEAEERGDTERRLAIENRAAPITIHLPNNEYRPYNKANGRIVYCAPTHVIFWKDEGDAVLTYKRTGNWYLRGVGGQPFFGRECLTWQLVASRFIPRYLPSGYVLDSGAPCAFTLDGVDRSELFFVIGWLFSPLANHVLKTVINHTRNIQSKDFERMPYPWWVSSSMKLQATQHVTEMISEAQNGRLWAWDDSEIRALASMYDFEEGSSASVCREIRSAPETDDNQQAQLSLFQS